MKTSILKLTVITFLLIFFTSCSDDDDTNPNPQSNNFTVTIENVFEAKDYFNSGTTGLITPGNSEMFQFNAGKGHSLQFATMFVKSNDLFLGASNNGIALYDENGNATTGDITSQIKLWDAGTEINEEPGMGANQPMNQAASNTGTAENGVVHQVNDAFTYPNTSNLISVMLQHDGGTLFTVTINNTSDATVLASPLAPGSWVVHTANQYPIFENGQTASMGLEKLAEDGDNTMINTNLSSNSGFVSPFAPGAFHIGTTNAIFTLENSASSDLEKLAEDGDPSGFTNVFNTPVGTAEAGALFPNNSYSFTFTAAEMDKLSLAMMLVQSNDWFFSLDNIDLYPNGTALLGDITSMINLTDAGTEVDEYTGAGNNQPVRQAGGNTGADENGNVMIENQVSDNVLDVSEMIKVTITVN